MNKSRLIKKTLLIVVALVAAYILLGEAKDILVRVYASHAPRTTDYPASTKPDQIFLTIAAEPTTMQAIQWRATATVQKGMAQYRKKDTDTNAEASATITQLTDPLIKNDPSVNRFAVTLKNLEPGTAYTYRVGDGTTWSDWLEFRTAPKTPEPFSFIYLGDAQVEFDKWNALLQKAYHQVPNIAFGLTAGDQANQGKARDNWDGFFNAIGGVFDHISLVPTIGNHECSREDVPKLYLNEFTLPENGPQDVRPERAYHFRYGNALFIVLDSNLSAPPEKERPWLEQLLSAPDITWRFVLFHHPFYASAPHRDNEEIRAAWLDLFDKYHVDIAFQGHDHAYLRTPPMKGDKKMEKPADGTFYIVSVSGTKFYDQSKHDYAAIQFAKTPTYQIINIETGATNKLTYRAYDSESKVRDEFTIEK